MHIKNVLSRRDFLKLSGLSVASLAFDWAAVSPGRLLPPNAILRVRVAVDEISIYKEPDYESDEVGKCHRDELLNVYDKVTSPYGPVHNPHWYVIDGGYVHTAHLQQIETHLNEVVYSIPEGGQLAEVTVPISLSFENNSFYGWQPLYRLYYQSVHWVHDVGYGPNGEPWYAIKDDLLPVTYHLPAKHMRLIDPEEVSPLATDVPPELKHILVNRTNQTVTAFEDGEEVFHTTVSTGMPHRAPGSTGCLYDHPTGRFLRDDQDAGAPYGRRQYHRRYQCLRAAGGAVGVLFL